MLAELLGPEHRFFQRCGIEAAEMLSPGDATTDEFGTLQHAHVFGGSGKGHAQGRREFAQVPFPSREWPDDRTSGGVGQGVKNQVQPG